MTEENKQVKKRWKVRTANKDREISLFPHFIVNEPEPGQIGIANDKTVECRFVDIELADLIKGGKIEMRMNFLDLFMFVYYIANEELRQDLQLRYERKISQIPYEVTFKLDDKEKAEGMAKRLITLGIDEIAMAMARSEAQLLKGKITKGSVEEFVHRKNVERQKGTINLT